MRMRLILVGFGNVGQGLAELLIEKRPQLAREHRLELEVVGIADATHGSLRRPGGIDLASALERIRQGEPLATSSSRFTGDPLALIRSTPAELMVEATPTDLESGEPAASHIRAAIERRMHVATTNKGPIALCLHELRRLAAEAGVELLFEGTVMSGTPLLDLHRETLPVAGVREVRGILNGTTNYILGRMEAGSEYDEALAEAQRLGYAETVPDADVLGLDALAKVTILAQEIFGARCRPTDFPCRGIDTIGRPQVEDALRRGRRIKLIGRVWREQGEVRATVAPEEVDLSHPLASIAGAANAVTISSEALGEITIVGPGAGRRETGYALLADIVRAGGDR